MDQVMKPELSPFEIYLLAADKGQIQLGLCSQGPVKLSEAPLS